MNIDEALFFLLAMYTQVPSITGYPVYIGDLRQAALRQPLDDGGRPRDRYGIVSCYNSLLVGEGALTLVRMTSRRSCSTTRATRDFPSGSLSGQTRSRCPSGWLTSGLPTRSRVWLTCGLQPVGHRDEAWL